MGKHTALANRLKELRRALGWTQQDLSRSSGLTRSYISRLEMGDIALPSSAKVKALAAALGTTSDDLLQAAGFLDSPAYDAADLPEIKVYLQRKYGIRDPRILQAIETIVTGLQGSAAQPSDAEAEERAERREGPQEVVMPESLGRSEIPMPTTDQESIGAS